jgi:hypothetical protein
MAMRIILLSLFCLIIIKISAQHTLVLKSGEKMNGSLKSYQNGTAVFEFKGNEMKFSSAEVASIIFDDRPAVAEPTGQKGVSYILEGRKLVKQPVFENLTMKKGIVVVAVTVDKYGSVLKASSGAEGTTTTDKYLLDLSKNAAQGAKFDNCPKCPLQMEGIITFTY